MRKLLLTIIILLAMAGQGWGDTHTSTKNGCWADPSVWDAAAVPESGDSVVVSHSVTVVGSRTTDCTATPTAAISLGAGTISGNGAMEYALDDADCHDGCAITAASITGGTNATGLVNASGTTDHILTITAVIAGGSTGQTLYHNSTGEMEITGAITGGTGAGGVAVQNKSTGLVDINGTVTGGTNSTAYGFFNSAAGSTFTVDGNVTGDTSVGVYVVAGTGTITGNITGDNNGIQAGLYTAAAATVTLVGNIINTATAPAFSGEPPTWNPGYGYYVQHYADSASTNFWVDTDPGVANVKTATTYYFHSSDIKTGTYTATGGGGAWGF